MDTFITVMLDPFTHEFMQRALFMSVLVGIVCSLFSCFLILKGWALMGDAVSHAVLPGLAISYLLGIPMIIGAFVGGLFCALATGYLKNNSRVKEDAVMGIVFSGMFALGLVMITKIESDLHLMHILFGNVLGISSQDFMITTCIASVCSIVLILKRRDLMLYCFDSAYANVLGFSVRTLNALLLILLALTIVAALKSTGIILVTAMLIAPGATAFLLTQSFDRMLIMACSVSVFSCTIGTFVSYYFDVTTAPLIVVIQSVLFLAAMAHSLAREKYKRAGT